MTKSGAPTPPPNEAEYARKLALAILSTLQTKGLLSAAEVDSILIAARRAAQGQASPVPAPAADARPAPTPFQVTVQPAPPPGNLSWHTVTPPAEKKKGEEKGHPVIDMTLD